MGGSSPQGWKTFGLGTGLWDFGGSDGDRCLSAIGDGAITNGWYASTWAPVEENHVYGTSFHVKKKVDKEGGWVFAGLNQVRRYSEASDQWEQQSFHFRTPDHRSGLRYELGQSRLNGTVVLR